MRMGDDTYTDFRSSGAPLSWIFRDKIWHVDLRMQDICICDIFVSWETDDSIEFAASHCMVINARPTSELQR